VLDVIQRRDYGTLGNLRRRTAVGIMGCVGMRRRFQPGGAVPGDRCGGSVMGGHACSCKASGMHAGVVCVALDAIDNQEGR
jgi:hypothetical protein